MKTVSITVTQEDIDAGLPESATQCPLALSLGRKFPDYHPAAFAGGGRLYHPAWDGLNLTLAFSPSAQRFMQRFDLGEPVEPARFRFTVLA